MLLYKIARRILFSMNPETAHAVTLANLDWAVNFGVTNLITHMPDDDPVEVMGLRFPNTVGLAAGMIKTASTLRLSAVLVSATSKSERSRRLLSLVILSRVFSV